MKILITGATGLLGQKIGQQLRMRGHQITVISRNLESAQKRINFASEILQGDFNVAPLAKKLSVDAVIHLAGESVAGGRWTATQKKKIYDSRIEGTKNLLLSLAQAPSQFIGASAIGFYGDRHSDLLDEAQPAGTDFLAKVCQDWESETFKASAQGVANVAVIRIGIVLANEGGALQKMITPFRLGLGGPLGSGQQWTSWIHIDDIVAAFLWVFENKLSGTFNGVAPSPVTNYEFSRTLAKTLHRPLAPAIPKIALKLLLGEMSQVVLASQKVSSLKVQKTGFEFKFSSLELALEELIKTNS